MEKTWGWTIFSWRKVPVTLHFSLLVLILYVLFVASIQFPIVAELSGSTPSGSPFLWAGIFAISLLVSIFVHEFGHVIMAQKRGHNVSHVTLMMLGGMSHIDRLSDDPEDEFKIAIVGPLVSLAIGGILFWIRSISDSANLDFFCYWVGQTNIVLGIFNLLPAFPTDGGRVLRSAFVKRQGRLRGTINAVRVSHVFAWMLGLLGLFQLNFLLMILAFFIYAAAKSELFVMFGQTLLHGLTVRDIVREVPPIAETATLTEASEAMVKSKNLVLPVSAADGTFGVLKAETLQRVPRHLWSSVLVKSIQMKIEKPMNIDEPLEKVVQDALAVRLGGIPVIEMGQLKGILRGSDLLELIQIRQLTRKEELGTVESFRIRHA